VSNSVSYTPSAADAEHQFALFEDAKMAACVGGRRGHRRHHIQRSDSDETFFAPVGDHTVAFRGSLSQSPLLLVAIKGRVLSR